MAAFLFFHGRIVDLDDYAYDPQPFEPVSPALMSAAQEMVRVKFPRLAAAFGDPRFSGWYWAGYMASASGTVGQGKECACLLDERLRGRISTLTSDEITAFLYLLAVHEAAALSFRFAGKPSGITGVVAAALVACQAYGCLDPEQKASVAAFIGQWKIRGSTPNPWTRTNARSNSLRRSVRPNSLFAAISVIQCCTAASRQDQAVQRTCRGSGRGEIDRARDGIKRYSGYGPVVEPAESHRDVRVQVSVNAYLEAGDAVGRESFEFGRGSSAR
jgi:hypothetical protein